MSAASALLVLALVIVLLIAHTSHSEVSTEALPSSGCCYQMSGMPKLAIRSESGEKTSHDLVDESMTIGRSPENSICLDDISVSSRHAELTMVGDLCHLKDLGSTNGTLVNGEPIIIAVQLRAGDRVRFGKVEGYYEIEVAGDAQPLPRVEEAEARPVDFANASPFLNRTKEKDRTRTAVFAAAAIAVLAFIGTMIAVFFMMQARSP